MPWAAIFELIVKFVGPAIAALLERWFGPKASKLPMPMANASGEKGNDAMTMLSVMLDKTPKVRVFRRNLLRALMLRIPEAIDGKPLTKADKAELATLAGHINE